MANKMRDLICGILFLALGIFMFFQSQGIDPIIPNELGSGFVPKIVAGVTAGLSVSMILVTFLKKQSPPPTKADEDLKGGIFTILTLATYVFLFDKLGFILSTMLYLFVQMTLLSNERNRNFRLFAGISVITPLVIYALFVYGFKLILPAGILRF
ncbi:MAG: tripartite tricarboxylate transporter TctB family protein [Firmicutes bacterium]|jgi:hypothetical protein|nr:tripartite tricarboxylate transporter TctB family protein [Bacillota bacterium]